MTGRGRRARRGVEVVLQALHSLLELGDTLAEVTAHIGQPLAEKEHADDRDKNDFLNTSPNMISSLPSRHL